MKTTFINEANNSNSTISSCLADISISLVFGIGYYIFKQFNKINDVNSHSKKEEKNCKWTKAETIQQFNQLIMSNTEKSTDAFKILGIIQKKGIIPDVVTFNCLLDMSFKLDHFEAAKRLFDEFSDFGSPIQPDAVSYNILLKGCVIKMKSLSDQNSWTLNKHLIEQEIDSILAEMKKKSIEMNLVTYNTAIDSYIESGNFTKAWNIYNDMLIQGSNVKPDLFTFATLIKGLKSSYNKENTYTSENTDINLSNKLNKNNLERTIEILNKIKSGECEGILVDEILYNSVLDTCIKFGEISKAEEIFEDMKLNKIPPTIITYSIMIKGYGYVYNMEKALNLKNEIESKNIKPNNIIYGCLLNCAVRCGKLDTMINIYQSMREDGIRPNRIIYTTLIKGFNKMKQFEKAFELFDSISDDDKINCNISMYNAILDCCVESKNFKKLNEIYNKLKSINENHSDAEYASDNYPKPNVITYSTMIKGHTRCGQIEEAKKIYEFLKMNQNYFALDEILFNTVCDCFARAGQKELAIEVFEDMKKANIKHTAIIYSILIKMYSSCGEYHKCLQTFDMMIKNNIKPSLVSYTTIIQMYLKQKKFSEAIAKFEEMKRNNLKPDHVIYNFLINNCTFNKKIEKAIEFLIESIRENIKLNDDTYGNCIEYLINNKFMNSSQRIGYASDILKILKENNFSIKYEIYSKLVKVIYKNNTNENEAEKNIINYSEKIKNGYNNYNSFNNDKRNARENLQKPRKHNFNK